MVEQPVLLITGTSRGVGSHLGHHYASRGYQVIGCSRGAAESAPTSNYAHHRLDVSVEAEVVALLRRIREEYGRLDVLINNAAVKPTSAVALLTPQASAAQAMSVNVLGTFLMCREGAKLMMRRRWGRIVNLGSMAVRHEFVGDSIYTASKAAVCSFSRVLAKELYPHGITCNVVAPSVVPTEMVSAVQDGALRDILARNAVPEPGRFEDISATIDWLIRPESQAVTAQIIYLGGA